MPRRQGQIAFASLTPPPEILAPERFWLVDHFKSGRQVTRYGRAWRIGKCEVEGDILYGQIGYDDQNSTTTNWDDALGDFRDVNPRLGYTSRFALNLETRRMAFELRGSYIRPWTFTTNLQALLSVEEEKWQVKVEGVDQPPWEDWVHTAGRITKVSMTLLPPNPRFRHDAIKSAFEDTLAASVKMVVDAGKGGSLDVENPGFIQLAIEHGLRYGSVTSVAYHEVDGHEIQDEWRSSAEKESRVEKVKLNDEERVARDSLTGALGEQELDVEPR
jgi:hypothetical protein